MPRERKTAYSEKLKDPRWQRKRLEICNRDQWACLQCGDTETTLHVHHVRYLQGHEPWDYPDHMLQTLCEVCHQAEYELRRGAESDLISMIRDRGFFCADVEVLASAFLEMPMPHIPSVVASAIRWALTNEESLQGIIDGYFGNLRDKESSTEQAPPTNE